MRKPTKKKSSPKQDGVKYILFRNLSQGESKAINDLKALFHTKTSSQACMTAITNYKRTAEERDELRQKLYEANRKLQSVQDTLNQWKEARIAMDELLG